METDCQDRGLDMFRDDQDIHPEYFKTTDSIVPTEVDTDFDDLRDLLTEHLHIVSGAVYTGPHQHHWFNTATDCRTER